MQRSGNDWVHVRMKKRDLSLPHSAPLVAYADRVADAYGLAHGAVPYPDPEHSGTRAEVLFVLSHPGRTAENTSTGSGLLSLENQDAASELCFDHCVRVGLAFDRITHWNAVPAPLPPGVNQPSSADVRAGAQWLPGLVELLPNLRVVALLGTNARSAWARTCSDISIRTLEGPSPGQRGQSNSGARKQLSELFDELGDLLGSSFLR